MADIDEKLRVGDSWWVKRTDADKRPVKVTLAYERPDREMPDRGSRPRVGVRARACRIFYDRDEFQEWAYSDSAFPSDNEVSCIAEQLYAMDMIDWRPPRRGESDDD